MDALETTAEVVHDWRGFGYDIANHLLVLSGKPTKTPTKKLEKKKKKETTPAKSEASSESLATAEKSALEMKPLGRKWFPLGKGGSVSPAEEPQGKGVVEGHHEGQPPKDKSDK